MKITTLSVAVTHALSSAAAFAQDNACRDAVALARSQCRNSNDPVACLLENIRDRYHTELRREQKNVANFPRTTRVGTRFTIDVEKYPGSANVLLENDLDTSTKVIRALGNAPGNDNGHGVGQPYSIRGFGYSGESRVIVMLDGMPRSINLYSNLTSSFRIDADLIQQVDVVRGSSSISHGGGGRHRSAWATPWPIRLGITGRAV